MFDTYTPSGKFGLLTPILVVIALAVVTALAFVYQLSLLWIPIVYVNFLATICFGVAIGFIGNLTIKLGHCRNVILAMLIGCSLLLVGIFAKFWFQYLTSLSSLDPRFTDLSFIEHLQLRVDDGIGIGRARGGGAAPVSGIFIYILWLVEFGMVAAFSVPAIINRAREPYSEQKEQWTDEIDQVMVLPVDDAKMVEKIMEAQTLDELLEIPIPKTDESNQFAVYTVNSIEGDEMEDAYLSVQLMTVTFDEDGAQKNEMTPLVTHAILPTEKREQLVENASLLNEAMDEYRSAVIAEQLGEIEE